MVYTDPSDNQSFPMTTTRTGRLVHLNKRRQAELNGVGHDDHRAYVVTENDDGTLVFTPAALSADPDLALFTEAQLDALFKPDSGIRFKVPAERSPLTDALDDACLAARQTGRWCPPEPDVDNAEPRLAAAIEAAEAAADAGGGEREAIAAALVVLGGREALESFGLTP